MATETATATLRPRASTAYSRPGTWPWPATATMATAPTNNHVVSLSYVAYCGAGGLDLSDNRDSRLGDVACGQPGALYFRY